MGLVSLPWSVVTALKMQPVGPVNPEVFGLSYDAPYNALLGERVSKWWHRLTGEPVYHVADLDRLRLTRDLLGGMVCDQRMTRIDPFYSALCRIHLEVSR